MPVLGHAGESVLLVIGVLLSASGTSAATVAVNFTALTLPNDFLHSKSDFIASDQNQLYFPLTKCNQMNEKMSRFNYPTIESPEFLNLTDGFVATLRGFENVDQSTQVQYLTALGDMLAAKSDLLTNGTSSWTDFFTGALDKDEVKALPAGWQYLESELLFNGLGGAECAELVNARPTSLGLLLKMVAVLRDQPDIAKADFLNNLGGLDPLFKSQLEYMLAYRWQQGFVGLSLPALLSLPADAVMAINGSQFDQMRVMDRLKNATAWNLAAPWSTAVWFQLVEKIKGFESMAGQGNISMYGHLFSGAPLSKVRRLVAFRVDSSALATIITNPAMNSLKVQELWSGLNRTDQTRLFPVVGYKLTPYQLQVFLQMAKLDGATLNWSDKSLEVPWSSLKVAGMAGKLKLASLAGNLSNWTGVNLQNLGNIGLVLSPLRLQQLNPQLFTRPFVESMLSSRMSTGQLKAIYDQFVKTAGTSSGVPPLLLSFLSPEMLAGPTGSSLVVVDKDLQNLLSAANRFVQSQTRALYEQLGNQLWSPSVLRSVLMLYPQLLAFTPVREFKTKINQIRDAVSLAGPENFVKIGNNIKMLPRRLLTAWLEQVFNSTNTNGMWQTAVLLDLPKGLVSKPPGGGSSSYASLFSQGEPTSLLPSLALTGLSCQMINKIEVADSLEVLAVYRAQLRDGRGSSGPAMPSNIRKCWARKVRKFLYLKSTLFNVTVQHEVELLSLMSTADIRSVGADVLLTWGGRILSGITHPQVMIESLIAVAQESPALYLNNGVWQSDMANMAEALFLALKSLSGSADLGVLAKMRDLVPYLANQYLAAFSKADIQVFVRSVLRTSQYSRTICTTAEGRSNLRDFIIKGFGAPETWMSGELVDLGDLLMVMTFDDFKKINSSILARAVPELVKESWYASQLSEIRGRERPLLYHEACAKWLSEEGMASTNAEADRMTAAWTGLGQMHLVGSSLYAYNLGSPVEASVIVPRRRRRQAVDAAPATVDLRALHDTVMSVVKNMFNANLLNVTQQTAAIKVVSDTQSLLGNRSLLILGYDPAKANLSQTQVLTLLSTLKNANNMTAAQSVQITQLASDTQVRIIQSLVQLLGLTPAQLNLTQANFNAVMSMPTFGSPVSGAAAAFAISSTTPSSSTTGAAAAVKTSRTSSSSSTTLKPGFLPGDERDLSIVEYDDPTDIAGAQTASSNSSAASKSVAPVPPASSGGLVNLPPADPSPLLLPMPDYNSLRLTCDALRISGRSASVLDSAAVGRMSDDEVVDCMEVFGRLDFPSVDTSSAIAADVWGRYGRQQMAASGAQQLGGNAMVMLGNLLPGLMANISLGLVDFNFKSNFDGLGMLGAKFRDARLISSSNNSNSSTIPGMSFSNSSSLAPMLMSLYLAANSPNGTGQRQLSDVEMAGLGQLLCGFNGTQWASLVPRGLAVGVREAVLAYLTCTPSDEVRPQLNRLAATGSGPAAVNWTSSDVVGLGWLLASLDTDILASIPPLAMDGMGAEAASSLDQLAGLTAGQLEVLGPYTASMLARSLAATSYVDVPRRRAIRSAGGESAELLRVLDQLESNYKLLNLDAQKDSTSTQKVDPTVPQKGGSGTAQFHLPLALYLTLLYSTMHLL